MNRNNPHDRIRGIPEGAPTSRRSSGTPRNPGPRVVHRGSGQGECSWSPYCYSFVSARITASSLPCLKNSNLPPPARSVPPAHRLSAGHETEAGAHNCVYYLHDIEESQHPMWPQVRHSLRCTQVSRICRHSSQPSAEGDTSFIWSRCVQLCIAISPSCPTP